MKIQKIMKKVNLNSGWTKVNLGKFTDFYLIGKKEKKNKSDTIDSTVVQKVRFEIGVDSGIKNKPLTINYINLNFNDITSSDVDLNAITAMTKQVKYPSEFYIKPVEFWDGKNVVKEGKTSISVTVNALNLE